MVIVYDVRVVVVVVPTAAEVDRCRSTLCCAGFYCHNRKMFCCLVLLYAVIIIKGTVDPV